MRVLGIDPGTVVVGYGVVEAKGNRLRALDYGSLSLARQKDYASRLARIHSKVTELLNDYRPDSLALESAFYGRNVNSALKIGESRGVVILCAAQAHVTLAEYSPAEVKKAVVGSGRAHKSQVQEMVRTILSLPTVPQPADAADALAMAVCHCHRVPLDAPGPGIAGGRRRKKSSRWTQRDVDALAAKGGQGTTRPGS